MEGGKEEDTWEFLVKVQIIYKLNKLVLQLDSLKIIFFIRAFKMLKKMKCKPMILSGPTDLQVESHWCHLILMQEHRECCFHDSPMRA